MFYQSKIWGTPTQVFKLRVKREFHRNIFCPDTYGQKTGSQFFLSLNTCVGSQSVKHNLYKIFTSPHGGLYKFKSN